MIKIKIDKIKEKSKIRPIGYFEDVISHGRINGEYIEFDDDDYKLLVKKYNSESWIISEPKITDLLNNFSNAVSRWAASGFAISREEEFNSRYKICSNCEFWDAKARFELGKCNHKKCGCTKFKLWLKTEKCPIDKW